MFPDRVFVLDGRTHEIKGFGGAAGKSMTYEEQSTFERVKELIFTIDSACTKAMGPLYKRQTMVGQRSNSEECVQVPVSHRTDRFETATFTKDNYYLSAPVSRRRSESARRAR